MTEGSKVQWGFVSRTNRILSAAFEDLPKGRATSEMQAPSSKRMFYQEAQDGNSLGGYSGPLHKTKSMTFTFRIIIKKKK